MSKQKKLRKIVLDKLYYKNQAQMKKSTRSNAPTQSTPNQPKTSSKIIQRFFQNFDAQCAIIHQPVRTIDRKPLKRSLQQQLAYLFKNDKKVKYKLFESQFQNFKSKELNFQNQTRFLKKRLYSSIKTQNQNYVQKSKDKRKVDTDEQFVMKYKSMIFNQKSSQSSTILSKKNSKQFIVFNSKQNSPMGKMQRLRQSKSKTTNIQQKQRYITNSKNIIVKNTVKNAPKKMQERQVGMQRIKRIQSLKNLNENGARKYFYKKDYNLNY